MIFCFSGTGNSLHVAEQIAKKLDDRIVMMTESELSTGKSYTIAKDETLGFVSPVYWWGMPTQVQRFIEKMRLTYEYGTNDHIPYVYAVSTYGLAGNNGLQDMRKCIACHQISLDATFEVKMVDNYIVGYELADREKQNKILKAAETRITEITESISNHEKVIIRDVISPIKPVVHSCYQNKNHSKKFHVTEDCIHCGKCEQMCPSNAIVITDGRPQWNQNCTFCLKCIHMCPKQAIQYGNTQGRTRYYYHGYEE